MRYKSLLNYNDIKKPGWLDWLTVQILKKLLVRIEISLYWIWMATSSRKAKMLHNIIINIL